MAPLSFRYDSWGLGAFLGIAVPVILYALIISMLWITNISQGVVYADNPKAPALAGVAANLLLFRYFMVNRKADKSGRAVLAATFVITVLIFTFL